MKLSSSDSSASRSERQKQSAAKGYRLSGRKLLLLIVVAAVAGGLLALSDLPGYLKANLLLVRHPEAASAIWIENDLDELHLEVKFKHLQKIEAARRKAMQRNRLIASDEDFVPAKISISGKKVDCKVRLKGDLADHWGGRKWSFRVEIKKKGLVMGMSRFSLQDPATRNHTNEWLFLENLRKEGLVAPRYKFINFTLNGKPMGTYAMEESFSKELIEHNRRREGVVVTFDDHHFWNMHWNVSWPSYWRTAIVETRNDSRVEALPLLRRQMVTASNLLRGFQKRELSGEEVFEPERLGKFLALTHLWSAEHALSYADINFYFDPITGKLEPIGREGEPNPSIKVSHCYFSEGEMEDTWLNQALRSPRLAQAYVKYLELYTRPEYLAEVSKRLSDEEQHLRNLLIKDLFMEDKHAIWKSSAILLEQDTWDSLKQRAHEIRLGLKDKHIALAYARPAKTASGIDCEVIILNALTQPIEIIGFELGKQSWSAKDTISMPSKDDAVISPTEDNVVMPLRKSANDHPAGDHAFLLEGAMRDMTSTIQGNSPESTLFALVRILGLQQPPVKIPVSMDHVRFEANLLPFHSREGEPTDAHPFLIENGNTYTIPTGDHNVTEDLVIPHGHDLLITPGATLRFASEATLISEGTIRAVGTPKAPITLTALDSSWGGVLVNNAPSRSEWHHVHVNKMAGVGIEVHSKGIDRAGWTLTGGVTFYYSPANFVHCVFEQSDTEDALNVISSDFTILGCSFNDLSSDAFDGDFVTGIIRDSVFEKIDGDAIDLSGSNVTIENVAVRDVVDKAISAGENTRIELSGSRFEDVGFGVASKDLSEVRIDEVQIKRARIAALAAYQKKENFGPAEISAKNLTVTESEKVHLVQVGSSLSIDGALSSSTTLDVEALYGQDHQKP
jgi:hypothetical protein